jgi:hypothetical protein
VGRFDYLPRDIENSLIDLLEKELDLLRKSDSLKRDLTCRYDYSAYATFRTIDTYNDGFIDSFCLKNFLKHNGHFANEREVLSIIRRIDTDGDAKLSYDEFSEFLRTAGVSSRNAEENLQRSYSQERGRRNLNSSASSPLRAKSSHNSGNRGSSVSNRYASFATPEKRSSPLRESGFSG